jgi:hypothetical protein
MVDSIVWIIKFNFITILMIPRDMIRFGSLRLVWEGDGKAEGILPAIKLVVTSLFGMNWSFTSADKFYQNRALKRAGMALINTMMKTGSVDIASIQDLVDTGSSLFDVFEDTMPLPNQDSAEAGTSSKPSDYKKSEYKEVYTYANYESVAPLFFNREDPICIVAFRAGCDDAAKHAIILKGYSKMVPVYLEELVSEQNGACYFEWKLGTEALDVPYDCTVDGWQAKQNELLLAVDHYGLLLPGYFRHALVVGEPKFDFYFITSEWLEMLGDKTMGLPRVIGGTY